MDLDALLLGWGFSYVGGEHGYRSYVGLGVHVVTFGGAEGWGLWADNELCFDKCCNCPLQLKQVNVPDYSPEEFSQRLKSSLTLLGSSVGYNVSDRHDYLTNNPFSLENQNES